MTPVQMWIACLGIACVAFCSVVAILALLAWLAGSIERYHVRRHARRRGGMLGESAAGFRRGAP